MTDSLNDPPFLAERVTWSQARDHLVQRLMMDEAWLTEGDHALTWWPTPLNLVVEAEAEDTFPGSEENWIRLTASTTIAHADDRVGRGMASEFTARYPVGALVYREGDLALRTSYAFNPRNRPLLAWFHQCVLIQAAVAIQLADEWQSMDGIDIGTYAHPTSGHRDDVDELVRIYGGDVLGVPVFEEVVATYEAVRPALREAMAAQGFTLGFNNEEVDFFNLGFDSDELGALEGGAFDIGVGFMHGTVRDRRFGPSLTVQARILPPGDNFNAEQASMANEDVSHMLHVSQFGSITGPGGGAIGTLLRGMIPHLTLADWAHFPGSMVTSVSNAISHISAAAQVFRREILEMP